MYDLYRALIGNLSNYLYTYILIILLVAGGIYFTVRTKFVQFRYLKESLRVVLAPSEDDKAISSFQALMVSTASRVGTGNIAGVSTAICLGGLGSLFWMWLTALLGMSTAFVEGTLAQIYKRRSDDGGCYGGPSYYIDQAIGKHWLGILFAVFMILTYMVGFNLVASFNIADALRVVPGYAEHGILQSGSSALCLRSCSLYASAAAESRSRGLQRRLFHLWDSSTLRLQCS